MYAVYDNINKSREEFYSLTDAILRVVGMPSQHNQNINGTNFGITQWSGCNSEQLLAGRLQYADGSERQ